MSYEDDDVSHRRRPPRRTGFKKLKWGRKKERMACDVGIGLAEEVMAEDHSTVKVSGCSRLLPGGWGCS